jgi:hypothetical protein
MGLLGALFGKKTPAQSGNQAYGQIKDAFTPWLAPGGAGMGQAASILGLNGATGSQEGLDNWWKSSGGDFLLKQGFGDIDARASAMGGGQSGATLRGMENYRQDLASTKLNEYLGNIFNLNQQSLGAGSLIASAGQQSTGEQKKGGGLGKLLGAGLSIFSDRRLKRDIERIGEAADGLGLYRFRYLWDRPNTTREGPMAEEVAVLRPWALGPVVAGYATIRPDLLEAA